MKSLLAHFTRAMIAGIVATLPVAGLVLTVLYLESMVAAGWKGIAAIKDHYFWGVGLIAVALALYGVGVFVSTFLGRWVLSILDGLLRRLPMLGALYQTLKQILGYDEGEDAVFERVVLVKSREHEAEEIGLVTKTLSNPDGEERLIVFVPASPTPTTGRLLVLEPSLVRASNMTVNEALTALVSVGKSHGEKTVARPESAAAPASETET
ncbi:MAG: hypothetical protein CMJ85_05365 [Planctomycetes bacterium]|nr:hypothetical protein [Planctomycetota bacterium]